MTDDVLTNDFSVKYDEARETFEITPIYAGKTVHPIRIRMDTLREMKDPQEACRWFGETILLLVPRMREQLFDLGRQTPDARRQTPDARRQTPDARRLTPDA